MLVWFPSNILLGLVLLRLQNETFYDGTMFLEEVDEGWGGGGGKNASQ